MNGRRLLPALAAALWTPALVGAEVNSSWETLVTTLKPGRNVVVVQHSGKRAEGKLQTLTGESITVQAGPQSLTIQRDEVFRVRVAGVRGKRALIGSGLGAAAGVAFGAKLGSRRHGLSAVVFGGLFAGIGAAGGAAIPTGKPLYEAPGGLKKTGP
jgi:hypothetical protein